MPDWDADSERLKENLRAVLMSLRQGVRRHGPLAASSARDWHRRMMAGLDLPDPLLAGRFRGEAGLENCEVVVGNHAGVPAATVVEALAMFDERLSRILAFLDDAISHDDDLDPSHLAAVVDVCAWVHSEWVRIHPFANGNGRTARIWANAVAVRYGLPPFVRLRPRPDMDYAEAAVRAMSGDWRATARLFRVMLDEALGP